ncbi:MAG: hypothetical protein IPO21_20825 [Bacteroidales bacterium]|nr:hypothetical protein [Bacteroidales bacterium]
MRYEVFAGIGATNFLGELGGSDKVGSNFLSDLEISMTRPALTVGGRYWIKSRLIFLTSFTYGTLWGNDSRTNEIYRNERDLHFRSSIWEWQNRIELTLLAAKRTSRYNLKRVRGRKNGNKFSIDVYAGISTFYFNPKQKVDGRWYTLKTIGTEGQNFSETRKPYSRLQVGIPVGLEVKYLLNRKWSVGIDIGPRFTFTDYLDDVSTTYADVDKIIEYNKNIKASPEVIRKICAAILSDENSTNDSHAATYQQRGNALNNDIYMFFLITMNYKLRTARNGLPKLR